MCEYNPTEISADIASPDEGCSIIFKTAMHPATLKPEVIRVNDDPHLDSYVQEVTSNHTNQYACVYDDWSHWPEIDVHSCKRCCSISQNQSTTQHHGHARLVNPYLRYVKMSFLHGQFSYFRIKSNQKYLVHQHPLWCSCSCAIHSPFLIVLSKKLR